MLLKFPTKQFHHHIFCFTNSVLPPKNQNHNKSLVAMILMCGLLEGKETLFLFWALGISLLLRAVM